jgi:hypothetical protein
MAFAGSASTSILRQALCRCTSSLTISTASLASISSFTTSHYAIRSMASSSSSSNPTEGRERIMWRDPRSNLNLPDEAGTNEPSPIVSKIRSVSVPVSTGAYGGTKQEEAQLAKTQSSRAISFAHSRRVPGSKANTVLAPLPPQHKEGSAADLEQRWSSLHDEDKSIQPATPTSARSLRVGLEEFQRQYRRLMSGVIAMNNIRQVQAATLG